MTSENNWRSFKIGVFGSAGGDNMETCKMTARTVGEKIAMYGGILCTGACPGLPHEAALGAAGYGAGSGSGIILGYSPAMNMHDHTENFKFPTRPYILTFTGMEKKGRNLICTRTCHAGIFIAGRWGTVNEFTLMCDEGEGKVIGLLAGSGGFVDSMIIPGLSQTDKITKAAIIIEQDPEKLVIGIMSALEKMHY